MNSQLPSIESSASRTRRRWLWRVSCLALPIALGLILREWASWQPKVVWRTNGLFSLIQKPIKLYDLSSDQSHAIISTDRHLTYVSTKKNVIVWQQPTAVQNSARFVPGDRLIVGDGVQVWDAATGRIRATLPRSMPSGTFSPNGRLLAGSVPNGDYKLPVWDTSQIGSGKVSQVFGLGKLNNMVSQVAFSPDSQVLAAPTWSANSAYVELWGTKDGKSRGKLMTPASDVAWSPRGRQLAVATEQGFEIWDAFSKKHLRTFHSPAVAQRRGLIFSPDAQLLVCVEGLSLKTLHLKTGFFTQVKYPYTFGTIDIASDSSRIFCLDAYNTPFTLRLK